MKILFMGTPDFAAGILAAIYESKKHTVTAVVTQPDRPKGRSSVLIPSSVKEYALSKGIDVLQPEKIKSPDEVARLKAVEADIYVVAAFGQILSKEILDIPPKGCINVHASLLPEYRGAAPIQWAIADGKEYTGVVVQQMNEGVDTGDVISAVKVAIAPDETGGSLFDKLSKQGAKLIVDTLDMIEKGEETHTPQDESKATYAKILKKEMGCIDFSKSAEEIERLVRAFTPWPGGYTRLNGKILKIKKCSASGEEAKGANGQVIGVTKDEIKIKCGSGTLILESVQPEGKKEMTVHDFLLGNRLQDMTVLGE